MEFVEDILSEVSVLMKKSEAGPVLFFPRREPVASKVFDCYWWFAAERQAIFTDG